MKRTIDKLIILISAKNKKQVKRDATEPDPFFILPILNNVIKNKLNFLVIFCN